jgi:hypothetical protein
MIRIEPTTTESPVPPRGRLLDVDPELVHAHYNRAPFRFRHQLSDHPLLQLESLIELANRLPREQVRVARGAKPVSDNVDATEGADMTLPGVMADLQHADAFILLWRPESDPVYRGLLDSVLDEVRPLTEPLDPGMCETHSFIFIVSPHAVTPYHMDRDINFLCQIRGTKTMQLWDHTDPSILTEAEIETFLGAPGEPRPAYRPENAGRARSFELGPGIGLHQPMLAPHVATSGDEVSIAMAFTFYTRSSVRRVAVSSANVKLRRLGLRPRPFGTAVSDGVKVQGMRAYRELRSLARRG